MIVEKGQQTSSDTGILQEDSKSAVMISPNGHGVSVHVQPHVRGIMRMCSPSIYTYYVYTHFYFIKML